MTKYYTPTKDEFFDGFKFETLAGEKFIESYYNTSWGDVDASDYRVKFLDNEDIINLGFRITESLGNKTVFEKNVISVKPTYYKLFFDTENDVPYVELIDMYNNVLLGRVHIKNISELKWLLNRYGVL